MEYLSKLEELAGKTVMSTTEEGNRVRDGKVTAVEALGFIRRQCAELEMSADDPLGVAVCKSSLGEIADVLDACLDRMPEVV